VQTLRFYLDAVRQLPAILGRAALWYITILTAIGSAIGYFGIKFGKSLVSWWENLSPWWGVALPIFAVATVLLAIAVHKRFQQIERERDALKKQKAELEKERTTDERRAALKTALGHAALEGELLHGDKPTVELSNDWAFRVAVMIWVAIEPGAVRLFYNDFEVSVNAVPDDSEVKQAIRRRLKHTHELIVRVDRDSLQVNPDFDHRDWMDDRPPRIKRTPQTQRVFNRVKEIRGDTSRQ
jgi:membrane protein implicated in regulation of membrane protease activity